MPLRLIWFMIVSAVLKEEDSTELLGVFETCPPPMIHIEGNLIHLSDRLQIAVECVAEDPGRTPLSSLLAATLYPVSGYLRAYSASLFVTHCPLDYETFRLSLNLNLDPAPGGTESDDVSFPSPLVAIVNSKGKRDIVPGIRSNSTVALFLRDPTPSPFVKYMCILDGKFYASTWRWSIFRITVVPETDDVISYGSTITLTDVHGGKTSWPLVVYETENGDGDGPVQELQSLAFHRTRKNGESTFIAMPDESRYSSHDGDWIDFELPLYGETPSNDDSLSTRARWTIVSISSFSRSFFDLFNRTPSVGLSPVVIPFPDIRNYPELDLSTNIISANISHFFYIDRATSQWTSYEVWLGVAGRLHTTVTAIYGKKGGCLLPNTPHLTQFSFPSPPVRTSVGGRNDSPPVRQPYARGSSILRNFS
jgi:hypothetical protein